MKPEGRYEWDEDGGVDQEGENVWIPQDVCDAVDRLATRMARGDYKDARLLLVGYYAEWREQGKKEQRQENIKAREEENLFRAEHGQGFVEFHTCDELVAVTNLHVPRGSSYQRIWKRACRADPDVLGCVAECAPSDASVIEIRTYKFHGLSERGLPVYKEMEP